MRRLPPSRVHGIRLTDASHRYHLKDVIVGKIYFLLVRIKIKHMELSIIRRETTGIPPNQYNESETITKFEIMDGAPIRGTSSSPHSAHHVAPGEGAGQS